MSRPTLLICRSCQAHATGAGQPWSGEGLYPFDASNQAYKLGVNYVIYGLTH